MPTIELLKKGFLFQNCSQEELDLLAQIVSERQIAAKQSVFAEGSQATAMFIIQHGTVEILKGELKDEKDSRVIVAELQAGTHFGEMAFVDRAPRAAEAVAKQDLKLLEIKFDDLERVVAGRPTLGLKLYHAMATTLCQRIRRTTADLSHILLH